LKIIMLRKPSDTIKYDRAILRLRRLIDPKTGLCMMRVIADRLNIKPQAPYAWRRVPPEHVLAVAEVSGMAPEQIRPDIYPVKAAGA
jgi:hypothetical protein